MTERRRDERFKIEGDPEEALRGLLAADPDSVEDPEAWARGRVTWDATVEGKEAITCIARIDADGQLFERREQGLIGKRDALRKRASDAVVRDYLDFIERTNR